MPVKARLRGVATSAQILHESNFVAIKQFECLVGVDHIIRINIDGVCALRVRLERDCEVSIIKDAPVVRKRGLHSKDR